MKKLLFILSILLSTPVWAWNQTPPRPLDACRTDAPYGFPQGRQGYAECRLAYATLNDTQAKLPVWTVYTLTPTEALGCLPRTNAFVADASIPRGQRAEPDDYTGTGYDRGHVAPDGDMSFDQQVEYESFLMTNMMPQLGGLNRGIWKLLETTIRGWVVQRQQSYTIYAGPIYSAGDPTIGANRVTVPHAFYKIVINTTTGETLGWVFPQAGNLGNDLTRFRAPISNIQQQTGLRFGFPGNVREIPPGTEWPVDFGRLTNAKRSRCGRTSE